MIDSAVFYGINTGFGSLCNKVISKTDLKQLQTNLVKSHACGSGDEIDPIIVKIMILLKNLEDDQSLMKLDLQIDRLRQKIRPRPF